MFASLSSDWFTVGGENARQISQYHGVVARADGDVMTDYREEVVETFPPTDTKRNNVQLSLNSRLFTLLRLRQYLGIALLGLFPIDAMRVRKLFEAWLHPPDFP